jgi:hypothetical protein
VAFVLERLRAYANFLKLQLPPAHSVSLSAEVPEEPDCVVFSKKLDGKSPWLLGPPSERHLRNASWIIGRSESELRRRMETYQSLWVSSISHEGS